MLRHDFSQKSSRKTKTFIVNCYRAPEHCSWNIPTCARLHNQADNVNLKAVSMSIVRALRLSELATLTLNNLTIFFFSLRCRLQRVVLFREPADERLCDVICGAIHTGILLRGDKASRKVSGESVARRTLASHLHGGKSQQFGLKYLPEYSKHSASLSAESIFVLFSRSRLQGSRLEGLVERHWVRRQSSRADKCNKCEQNHPLSVLSLHRNSVTTPKRHSKASENLRSLNIKTPSIIYVAKYVVERFRRCVREREI